MGLFTELLLLPVAPARMAMWTAGQVIDRATREFYDPAAVRRELAYLSQQLDDGLLSTEEIDRREDELLDRLAEGAHGLPA